MTSRGCLVPILLIGLIMIIVKVQAQNIKWTECAHWTDFDIPENTIVYPLENLKGEQLMFFNMFQAINDYSM